MEGKIWLVLAGVLIGASQVSFAQTEAEYRDALAIAENLLQRTIHGVEPCHTQACRSEKTEFLHEVYRLGNVLAFINPDLVEKLQEGVFSARKILDSPREAIESRPQSLEDWMKIYELRMSRNLEHEAKWLGLSILIEGLQYSLKVHLAMSRRLSSEDKKYFQDLWDKGYAEILSGYREAQELGAQEKIAMKAGDLAKAQEYRDRKIERHFQGRDWLRKHDTSLMRISNKFYPGLENERVTDIVLKLQHWSSLSPRSGLFSSSFIELLSRMDGALTKLLRSIRSYNDLEYGVVGLNNFESLTNPVVRVAHEHQAQMQLEEKLAYARYVINTGQSSMAVIVAASLGGSSRLLQFGLIGLSNYLQDVLELRIANKIIPESKRLDRLNERYAYWEPRLVKRKEELERTKLILEEKISEYRGVLGLNTEGNDDAETWTP